ncbi:hypothetical protein BT93_L4516 [Corymbia citriodora subsp. variegata]|uniref:Uncharacterized protein n=1 Tax=Corymbia citriodora subsp. variegata TaxID=360336 RepID=A0A8T0CGT8_CORYI|nr:hypothetical protein BT93_L4516 [Corymbia citriodora subsp. variegata]
MESSFNDHGWDVKAVDWHPTKGLIVSGSKDHSVKLWDPRTSRTLTTLHGHKNAISTVSFSRLRTQLLATAARDGQSRIFDLRMMRDVAILRGHEKGVTSLAWHPIHPSVLSTGGEDGALNNYLLTEPNTPPGISTATISPYSTSTPRTSPPQSIYPCHRIPFSHESSIWSLSWHPLGHILATGSNDHYIRFWSRTQPGDPNNSFKDKYHLGEEAAEAQGTYDKTRAGREKREQEEQEAEDEAEGLEDQRNIGRNEAVIPGLPGLPGLVMPSMPVPGATSVMPALGFENGVPRIDPSQFQKFLQPGMNLGMGMSGLPPPPPGMGLPPGFPMPGNIPLPMPGASNGLPGLGEAGLPGLGGFAGPPQYQDQSAAGTRTRAPLPSQSDGFKQEQARGNFRVAR